MELDGGSWGELGDWVLQAVPDGLWVLDDDGTTLWANDRLAQMLGLPPQELVGFSAYDALDATGRELRGHLDRLRADVAAEDEREWLLVRRDGTTFWALVGHAPLLDAGGRRRGWLHRVRDHSAQHRLVDDLRHREAQLAEAQATARIGSWDIDVATGTIRWSDELFRVMDVEVGAVEPAPSTFFALLAPEDRGEVEAAFETMSRGGTNAMETDARIARRPGLPARWVRVRGSTTRDEAGEVVRMGGTVQDVTERKESENAQLFLSAMAAAANEAGTLLDLMLSSRELIHPYSQWPAVIVSGPHPDRPGDLIHLDAGWTEVTPEVTAAARTLAERAHAERTVVQAVSPRGTVLIAGPALVRGDVACVVVSDTLDVIEPVPSYVAVFRQMLTLLAHVAERELAAKELEAARDDALEASRAKSEFLATMSHEIRTPLNGVIGLSELLIRTELTVHQRRLAEGVDQAGRALLALVNDILDLSKIEAGRLDLEEVDFDPRQVIEQSVSLLAERASGRDLELVVGTAGDIPTLVRGDPVRFGQVITNLVANAVKFTHEGEVVVRATSTGGSGVRVEVSDTGIGIEPDVQAHLFDAFSQADSSTTREYGGTGLGLAISERIVRALEGGIGVDSEPGVGSTFWFTADFGAADGDGAPDDAPGPSLAGLRVLVVDDNETNRFILAEQLAAWDVEAVTVASAYDALVELDASVRRGSPYDVALLDYMMPGMDGEQLARTLRCEERHDRMRLALLSSATEPTREWLAAAGIDSFLAKPVFPTRLREVLTALGGRAADAPSGETAAPDEVTPGSRGRVLVVEDNPVNQLVAEGILRRLGYDLELAENGAEAVSALADRADRFDVVLMDCQMPVMDGFDATRAVRAMVGGAADIPIIAMTAAATEAEREHCREAGMDDFLTKPVVPDLLEETLARWVTRD